MKKEKEKGGRKKKEEKWAILVGAELLPNIWKMPKRKMSRSQLKIYYFIILDFWTWEMEFQMSEDEKIANVRYCFEIFRNVEKTIRIVAIKIIIRNVDKC